MRFEATRSAKAIGFEGRGFEAFVLAGLTARQSSPPTLSDAPGDKQPGGTLSLSSTTAPVINITKVSRKRGGEDIVRV